MPNLATAAYLFGAEHERILDHVGEIICAPSPDGISMGYRDKVCVLWYSTSAIGVSTY